MVAINVQRFMLVTPIGDALTQHPHLIPLRCSAPQIQNPHLPHKEGQMRSAVFEVPCA